MVVPHLENSEFDKLAIAASTLEFIEVLIKGNGKFEINFRRSIPDNLDHWQVFKDDKQIINFINNKKEFLDFQVSYQEEKGSYKEEEDHRRNPVPKKVVEWERTFDRQDTKRRKPHRKTLALKKSQEKKMEKELLRKREKI